VARAGIEPATRNTAYQNRFLPRRVDIKNIIDRLIRYE
jgi:hypothetical protein